MSDKFKFKKSSRKFLNPKGHWDTGILMWNVDQDKYGVDASFTLWDCSRKIALDFSFYDRKGMEQRAKKLDVVIQELLNFKETLADAAARPITYQEEPDDS